MYPHRLGARSEYRRKVGQRVRDSARLADKFPRLKSLRVNLSYYNPDGVTKSSQIKYVVNVKNAKAVFRFNCPNHECIRGDFDLSEPLAKAIGARQTSVRGTMICQGWRSKAVVNTTRCQNVLKYTLTLTY